MENAVQALKTAAAVLIFVIAITVAFTMFSRAKTTADAVVKSQDKQEYLEAAELESTLYTSSDEIKKAENGKYNATMTTNGDRIVKPDDVISTIYRYYLEKYGVTIVNASTKKVIARFDSATESFVQSWTPEDTGKDKNGKSLNADDILNAYANGYDKHPGIKDNISNDYVNDIKDIDLKSLYAISNNGKGIGAPWLGKDQEIIRRINQDIEGKDYTYLGHTYRGKSLKNTLDEAHKIVEVVNTIDNSKYLKDKDEEGKDIETKLLQEYELPIIEVIYIIY